MFCNKVVSFAFILLLGGQHVAAASAQLEHKSAYDRFQSRHSLLEEGPMACDGGAVMALDTASSAVEFQVETLAENCRAAKEKGLTKCAAGSDDPVDTQALLKLIQDQAKRMQAAMSCAWAKDWVEEHGKMQNRADRLLKNLESIFHTAPELTGDLKESLKFDFTAVAGLGEQVKSGSAGIEEAVTDAMSRFVGKVEEEAEGAEEKVEALVKGAEQLAKASRASPASKLSNFDFCYRPQNSTWQRFSNYFLGSGTGCDANQGCYAVSGKEFSEQPSLHVLLGAELVEDDGALAKSSPETWGVCLPKNQGKTAAKQFFADVKKEISALADSMKVASGLGGSSFAEGGIAPDAQMMAMVNTMLVAGSGYSGMAAGATALVVFEAVTLVLVPYKLYEVAATGEVGRATEILTWLKGGLKSVLMATSCTMLHGLAITGTFTHLLLNGVKSIDATTGLSPTYSVYPYVTPGMSNQLIAEGTTRHIMTHATTGAAVVGALLFLAGILWLMGVGENALGWSWSACAYHSWSAINHATGLERIRRDLTADPPPLDGLERIRRESERIRRDRTETETSTAFAQRSSVQAEPAAPAPKALVRRSAVVRADGDA